MGVWGKNDTKIQDIGAKIPLYLLFLFITYDVVQQYDISKSVVFPEYQRAYKCDTDFIQMFSRQDKQKLNNYFLGTVLSILPVQKNIQQNHCMTRVTNTGVLLVNKSAFLNWLSK